MSDYSGTTRDTIDTDVTSADGVKYTLIDTAGIRRRTSVAAGKDRPEELSVGRALPGDAPSGYRRLGHRRRGGSDAARFRAGGARGDYGGRCGLVLCVNKWDKIDKDSYSMNEYTKSLRSKLRVFEWASVVYTSALTGNACRRCSPPRRTSTHHRKRLTTATLNAVVQEASLWKSPPSRGGRKGKIYYATQASTRPPTFVFFVNDPKLFVDTYRRSTWNDRCARTSDSRRPCASYGAVRAWEESLECQGGTETTSRGAGRSRENQSGDEEKPYALMW